MINSLCCFLKGAQKYHFIIWIAWKLWCYVSVPSIEDSLFALKHYLLEKGGKPLCVSMHKSKFVSRALIANQYLANSTGRRRRLGSRVTYVPPSTLLGPLCA